jgi:hypothetical protein
MSAKRRTKATSKRPHVEPECPGCQSKQVKPILYGLPGEELLERYVKGEVRLGGCCIQPNLPTRACEKCEFTW